MRHLLECENNFLSSFFILGIIFPPFIYNNIYKEVNNVASNEKKNNVGFRIAKIWQILGQILEFPKMIFNCICKVSMTYYGVKQANLTENDRSRPVLRVYRPETRLAVYRAA